MTSTNVVYKITFEGSNKFYVGSAVDLKRRTGEHKYFLKKQIHCNPIMQNLYNKWGSPIFSIIDSIENREELLELEQHYLNTLKPDINICEKANSTLGRKHTDKTKKLMSEGSIKNGQNAGKNNPMYGRRGKDNPLYGRKRSEETKAKIGAGNLGKIMSPESCARISASKRGKMNGVNNPFYGKRHTPETKEKMKQSALNRK